MKERNSLISEKFHKEPQRVETNPPGKVGAMRLRCLNLSPPSTVLIPHRIEILEQYVFKRNAYFLALSDGQPKIWGDTSVAIELFNIASYRNSN
jgi:hypothetical protein